MPDTNIKEWWKSKTIWVNLIAALAIIIQLFTGFVVTAEEQAAAIIVINLFLRVITNTELKFKN